LLEHLDQQHTSTLAEVLLQIRERQDQLKEARQLVEDELRRRMDLRGRRAMVVGDYGLEIKAAKEAVWDADEAEGVLRQLVDDGVLQAREAVGCITHEVVVHRTEINRLLDKLAPAARRTLEQCRRWRTKGSPRLIVERQVQLVPPDDQTPAALKHGGVNSPSPRVPVDLFPATPTPEERS
jgi:hypothetical protein